MSKTARFEPPWSEDFWVRLIETVQVFDEEKLRKGKWEKISNEMYKTSSKAIKPEFLRHRFLSLKSQVKNQTKRFGRANVTNEMIQKMKEYIEFDSQRQPLKASEQFKDMQNFSRNVLPNVSTDVKEQAGEKSEQDSHTLVRFKEEKEESEESKYISAPSSFESEYSSETSNFKKQFLKQFDEESNAYGNWVYSQLVGTGQKYARNLFIRYHSDHEFTEGNFDWAAIISDAFQQLRADAITKMRQKIMALCRQAFQQRQELVFRS